MLVLDNTSPVVKCSPFSFVTIKDGFETLCFKVDNGLTVYFIIRIQLPTGKLKNEFVYFFLHSWVREPFWDMRPVRSFTGILVRQSIIEI